MAKIHPILFEAPMVRALLQGTKTQSSKLKRDIRAIARGKAIARPEGTLERPVPTYGGDTILRIPKHSTDDRGLMENIQREVARIYFAADKYLGEDRIELIRREVAKQFSTR